MKLEDFSFKANYIEVAGYNIHYLDEGAGETILMLHGNPTWSYLYRKFIPDLSQHYRCIAPDFLGFGYSDKPPGADYSLQTQLDRLAQFIKQMKLTAITLVVHDIGGIVGLAWAAQHKHLVKRLVILNSSGSVPAVFGKDRYLPPWSYLALLPLRIPGFGQLMVGHFNVLHRVIMPVAIGKRGILTKEVRRGFEAPYRCKKNREAQLSTARQIPIFKSDNLYHMLLKTGHALRGWQVATQIIWGLRDPSFTKKIARDLERLLPNHHPTVYLPKAGHFLTEEQPELVLAAIKKFLANTS